MTGMVLAIGNRNYSSWSLRAWLVLAWSGLAFEERRLPLGTPAFAGGITAFAPSRLVPALTIGDAVVWDSLAIAETVAERAPEAGLWPRDEAARAFARALAAEMHSSYGALRQVLPMNLRARYPGRGRDDAAVQADIARITDLWRTARERFGAGGPYLFGARTIADAFYAPVAFRFRTYDVPLDGAPAAYRDALLADADVAAWDRAAAAETEVIARFEV